MRDKISGMSGWREFLQNRQEILNKFDVAKQKIFNRPVKAAHGNVAEAAIRNWLSNFLPRKYGVTSGYIIPNIYGDASVRLHYDIIIYEQLESPVLWVDSNDDESIQGRKLAIPAKYVRAVYEVKSVLNKKSALDASSKLSEINSIKDHLKPSFHSGAIFIDLLDSELRDKKILPALLNASSAYGCWGGAVLRSAGDELAVGLFSFFKPDADFGKYNSDQVVLFKPIDSVDVRITETGDARLGGEARFTSDGVNTWYVTKQYNSFHASSTNAINLCWSRSGFSDLALKILNTMEGFSETDPNRTTFGMVYELLERVDTPIQLSTNSGGIPFVNLSVRKYESSGTYLRFEDHDSGTYIYFTYQAENTGSVAVELTTNLFAQFASLELEKVGAMEEAVFVAKNKGRKSQQIVSSIRSGSMPLKFSKRFVYRYKTADGELLYCAIPATFEIYLDSYQVVMNGV